MAREGTDVAGHAGDLGVVDGLLVGGDAEGVGGGEGCSWGDGAAEFGYVDGDDDFDTDAGDGWDAGGDIWRWWGGDWVRGEGCWTSY